MKTLLRVMIALPILTAAGCSAKGDLFTASGYSSQGKNDIAVCRLSKDGKISVVEGLEAGNNPSFFTAGRNGLLYFVNEVDSFGLKTGGGITTFRIDRKTGALRKEGEINQGGGGPCHVALTDDSKFLITANYGSGSVSVVKLGAGGIPSEVTDLIFFGEASHPHMTLYNRRKGIYFISDLGLDRIHQLKLDTLSGRMTAVATPYIECTKGDGPRHMLTDREGTVLYVINELGSTVSVFDILPDQPALKQKISTLTGDFTGKNYCADIHFSPDRKVIYCSNRGDNSIAVFDIKSDGTLASPQLQGCGGDWPRNFAVSPSGRYLLVANQRSNDLSVIKAGGNSGGEMSEKLLMNAPACISFIK